MEKPEKKRCLHVSDARCWPYDFVCGLQNSGNVIHFSTEPNTGKDMFNAKHNAKMKAYRQKRKEGE